MTGQQLGQMRRAGAGHGDVTVRARAALIVVVAGVVSLTLWGRLPTTYVSMQWRFSYADGLIERSLVGTVYRGLGGDVGPELATTSIIVYLIVVAVLAVALSGVVLDGRGAPWMATPLVVGVLLAPSGLPALAAGRGQLDAFLVAIAAGAVVLADRGGSRARSGVAALLTLAVAVHEAALFLVVPWVCVYLGRRRASVVGSGAALAEALFVAVPAVLFTIASSLHQPGIGEAALATTLAGDAGPGYDAILAAGVHHRGALDTLAMMGEWIGRSGFLALVVNGVSILPVLGLAWVTLREGQLRSGRLPQWDRLLLLASAAPLAMCFLGSDWGRWFSAVGTLFGASCVVLLRDHGAGTTRPSRFLWVGAALVVLVTLVVGATQEHALGLAAH